MDEAEVMVGGPVDELAEGAGVADAEIMVTAEGEEGGEDTGERIFGDGRDQGGRIGGRLKQGKREKSRLEDWGDGKQFECLARVGRGG